MQLYINLCQYIFIVKFQNFTRFLSVLFGLSHPKFSFFFTIIFLCRPLTEEEIVDLRERHYDSIAEKQKALDMKIQKEVKSLLCCFKCYYKGSVYREKLSLNNILHTKSLDLYLDVYI